MGGLVTSTEAGRAWKQAQLSINERLGPARVVALHAVLEDEPSGALVK